MAYGSDVLTESPTVRIEARSFTVDTSELQHSDTRASAGDVRSRQAMQQEGATSDEDVDPGRSSMCQNKYEAQNWERKCNPISNINLGR